MTTPGRRRQGPPRRLIRIRRFTMKTCVSLDRHATYLITAYLTAVALIAPRMVVYPGIGRTTPPVCVGAHAIPQVWGLAIT
jgi:hypothetical protein